LFFVDRFPRNKFIAFGIAGCMASLIIECALDATYASASALLQPNESALKAAVAMIYVYVVFYEICLDGAQFAYLGEIFPTHLRAKGIAIGVAGICLMNIIWLQCEFDFLSDLRGWGFGLIMGTAAPTAFANIHWRFYLCFIIPGCLSVVMIWFLFPDTLGIPLEEVAAIFGDDNEIYHAEREAEKVVGIAGADGPAKSVGDSDEEDIEKGERTENVEQPK
jgi:MFS family permease